MSNLDLTVLESEQDRGLVRFLAIPVSIPSSRALVDQVRGIDDRPQKVEPVAEWGRTEIDPLLVEVVLLDVGPPDRDALDILLALRLVDPGLGSAGKP